MKCSHCGFDLSDQALFCPQCGVKVVRPQPTVAAESASSSQPVQPTEQPSQSDQSSQPSQQPQQVLPTQPIQQPPQPAHRPSQPTPQTQPQPAFPSLAGRPRIMPKIRSKIGHNINRLRSLLKIPIGLSHSINRLHRPLRVLHRHRRWLLFRRLRRKTVFLRYSRILWPYFWFSLSLFGCVAFG